MVCLSLKDKPMCVDPRHLMPCWESETSHPWMGLHVSASCSLLSTQHMLEGKKRRKSFLKLLHETMEDIPIPLSPQNGEERCCACDQWHISGFGPRGDLSSLISEGSYRTQPALLHCPKAHTRSQGRKREYSSSLFTAAESPFNLPVEFTSLWVDKLGGNDDSPQALSTF